MKIKGVLLTVLGCLCFLLVSTSAVMAQDAATTASQVSNDLQKSRAITKADAAAMKAPLENMIAKGATKDDLKNTITNLSKDKIKGKDLQQTVTEMSDLVNEGENPKEAGNVVSQAAAQAKAQGLKGTALSAKVHEAIALRKTQKKEAKEKARKEAEERARKAAEEKAKKEAEAKAAADAAKKAAEQKAKSAQTTQPTLPKTTPAKKIK